ncbi:MAG: alpha/beta fold hydrolase [Elusimicrobia bacterium]|nr:alpha/beta fold hydrolase [Elusimicrobiota bacterium]
MNKTLLLIIFLLFVNTGYCVQTLQKKLQLPGEKLELETSDNWKISATYKEPAGDNFCLLLIHSLGKKKDQWSQFAATAGRLGYGYLALDLRGHGESLDNGGVLTLQKNFRKTGLDNEFNQMTRDVNAAIDYLSSQGIAEEKIVIIGFGFGANLAIKSAALRPLISMTALISPTFNSRDVLTVNPMRAYGKRPVCIVTPDKKNSTEAGILKTIAARTSSEPTKVTYVTRELKKPLEAGTFARIFQWLKTPVRPPEGQPSAVAQEQPSSEENPDSETYRMEVDVSP